MECTEVPFYGASVDVYCSGGEVMYDMYWGSDCSGSPIDSGSYLDYMGGDTICGELFCGANATYPWSPDNSTHNGSYYRKQRRLLLNAMDMPWDL